MVNVVSGQEEHAYNDFAMAVPSIIFAEIAVAIGGLWGDKNRCNRRRGTGRRPCIIRATKPGICL